MEKETLKNLSEIIKNARSQIGLSQFSLASLAEVSLPTVQNIEAGKANPSLEVMLKLFKVLKMDIQYTPQKINWDCLIQGGVPLTSSTSYSSTTNSQSTDDFEMELKRAYFFLTHPHPFSDSEPPRNWEALIAYLWALSSHYPLTFKKIFKSTFSIENYLKLYSLNKLIKLRRLALAQIKNY